MHCFVNQQVSIHSTSRHLACEPTLPIRMNSLSPELWHMVASHLSIQDATQLRLASRFFADVAGAHILPEVTFHVHQNDFTRLRGIANSRVLAPNVKSVTYFTMAYESPVISFDKFKKNHKERLMLQSRPFLDIPGPLARPADDLTLWHEYEKYERLVAVQDQIQADMADLVCLKEALANFTGLRHATMSSGNQRPCEGQAVTIRGSH